MKLIEGLERRTEALKPAEVARLLGVTPQHIYRMAADGEIPCFRFGGAIRFDPRQIAEWLRKKVVHSVPAPAQQNTGSAS